MNININILFQFKQYHKCVNIMYVLEENFQFFLLSFLKVQSTGFRKYFIFVFKIFWRKVTAHIKTGSEILDTGSGHLMDQKV